MHAYIHACIADIHTCIHTYIVCIHRYIHTPHTYTYITPSSDWTKVQIKKNEFDFENMNYTNVLKPCCSSPGCLNTILCRTFDYLKWAWPNVFFVKYIYVLKSCCNWPECLTNILCKQFDYLEFVLSVFFCEMYVCVEILLQLTGMLKQYLVDRDATCIST